MLQRFLTPIHGQQVLGTELKAIPRHSCVWEVGAEDMILENKQSRDWTGAGELRLTLGSEVEDVRGVSVALAKTNRTLGVIDVRYGCTFQPFGLKLSEADAQAILAEGVRVSAVEQIRPVYLFQPTTALDARLGPRLISRTSERNAPEAWQVFKSLLASTVTLQPFNWIEGCVLDGLRALGAETAVAQHLEYFFPDNRLEYTGPRGEPRREEIFGIEALLPFAFLPAKHPGIRLMEDFVTNKIGEDGLLLDRGEDAEGRVRSYTEITIEGCYTLSYPLAVACLRDGKEQWRQLAWAQIEARCKHLVNSGVVAQRARLGGRPEQADWARAYGWFLLGVARTTETLGNCPPQVAKVFNEVAKQVLKLQREDGLWSVYLSELETGSDTSGSAAITAGLALGMQLGLIPATNETEQATQRALAGFLPHLADDGMLGGVAQLNRGGEALQRNGFRVIAPFAMGLLGSALAVLNRERKTAN